MRKKLIQITLKEAVIQLITASCILALLQLILPIPTLHKALWGQQAMGDAYTTEYVIVLMVFTNFIRLCSVAVPLLFSKTEEQEQAHVYHQTYQS
ncbi:hypothetical protein OKW21_003438 [Catalinimonas alkaloidigena]|uniref:hypothetical protein n=1 Tax=Catalinimonas alkaloidigena TaxID=1075417 RepID=UPI0024049143|nr:hypothetical protein [Catalinimonas alkaloidigena]MDF9798175.1 hypothetical protein [Catalinimonas alkaloidigena]